MKYSVVVFFCLLFFSWTHTYSQSKIQFFNGTLEKAMAQAKEENKPLFIEFSAVWCGPCRQMERETFTDPVVASYFNEKYINVKLDVDHEGREFAIEQGVQAIPHFIFMNSEGKKVMEKGGFFAPHLFIKVGKKANKKARK